MFNSSCVFNVCTSPTILGDSAFFAPHTRPNPTRHGIRLWPSLQLMYVRLEVTADLDNARFGPQYIYDPEPNRIIGERFKNVVFDDKEKFDGVGFDFIYDTFREWLEDTKEVTGTGIAGKECLVIDDKVFKALVAAPDPSFDLEEVCYMKVLDCAYKHADAYGAPDPEYPGWIKEDIGELWGLYNIMESSVGLETRYEKGEDGMLYFE